MQRQLNETHAEVLESSDLERHDDDKKNKRKRKEKDKKNKIQEKEKRKRRKTWEEKKQRGLQGVTPETGRKFEKFFAKKCEEKS